MPDPIRQSISATEAAALFGSRVKVDPESHCWVWTGAKNTHGYGHLNFKGRFWQAHRLAYELLRGQIPAGRVIDHLCRNRACVNPAHLEPVTNRENLLRGVGFVAVHAAKTHCPHGHPYSSENTYVSPSGERNCRACKRARDWRRAYA